MIKKQQKKKAKELERRNKYLNTLKEQEEKGDNPEENKDLVMDESSSDSDKEMMAHN